MKRTFFTSDRTGDLPVGVTPAAFPPVEDIALKATLHECLKSDPLVRHPGGSHAGDKVNASEKRKA